MRSGVGSLPGSVAMRKFFQEIKADLKFRSAGPGQKLSEPARYGVTAGPAVGPGGGARGRGVTA